MTEEDYPGQKNDIRRGSLIRQAVEAGDRIIMEGADGSGEELEYLTASIALEWARKVLSGRCAALLRKDLTDRK